MHTPSSTVRRRGRRAARVWALVAGGAALTLAIGGCGSDAATVAAVEGPQTSCQATVVEDLARVARRVYREGVQSERTIVAQRFIADSAALRSAVQDGDAAAARSAAQALVKGGHMTNLRVVRDGAVLADVGGPALAPVAGTISGAPGAPAADYLTSVWSDEGFLAETDAIAEGRVALSRGGRSVGGSFPLPAGGLPPEGSSVIRGALYQYASFGAIAFPSGHVRVYVLRTERSLAGLCAPTREATTYNTLARVATLVYRGEAGRRTLPQIRRVQANAALLEAVAARDPLATRKAVAALLHEHIVRLRVYAAAAAGAPAELLDDDGGPYVLAPVTAPLRLHGRTIGHIVLSIQDDEGYLRLTRRLAGLSVLMYMAPNGGAPTTLVKNSLGPEPGAVPERGRYLYRGRTFQVYTLHAEAFPSGPLTIHVLIPVPYS